MPTRVAAWQCRPGVLDVAGNLRRLDDACAAAAASRASVLVTPEMFTSGYGIGPGDARRLALEHVGSGAAGGGSGDSGAAGESTAEAVAEIARRHRIAIAYGHPLPAPSAGPDAGRGAGAGAGGGVYNAATLVGPDGVVRGQHQKTHLYGDLDRSLFVAAGSPPLAFDFGFGGLRVGMLICYDVEFPEAVRSLAVSGARLVLVPTANMEGYESVQEILVRARACENGCGVVYANYCGADDVFAYNGRSVICGPDGSVLASAERDSEELLVADVPHSSADTYLKDRRPDLYSG